MITFNELYTKIRSAVLTAEPTAYVTATYVPKPGKFPAVFVREISRFTPTQYVSFAHTDNVHESTIEVQIFSNKASGAKTQADNLLGVLEATMRGQYYVMTSAAPVDNIDSSVYRITARFRRIVGGADTINT